MPAAKTAEASIAACQLNQCTSRPPLIGASMPTTPSPASERDITRAPSCGGYRSRTMDRPQVTAAASAAPCSARHAIKVSIVLDAALSTLAKV